ncbi:MAG TPA: metalloprotease PmbA [Gammaproteobacteria bacterium]|nr:metalloprotease PmbA [Gammaproteobacteria bacterium]
MLEVWNNPEYVKNVAADILKEAARQGASSAEVDIGLNKGFSVTSRLGEVESVEYNQDKIVDITVYFGHRTGSASLSDLRFDAIQSAVAAACNIARFGDKDIYGGLAEKDLLAFNYPELNLSFPWDISVEQAIEITKQCENMALSEDKRIQNSEGASLSTTQGSHVYGNSHGFMGAYHATRHDISCALVAGGEDEMQRDYSYTLSCDPAMLESIEWVARTAAEKTVRRLGAARLSTRKVPVIFAAEEARGFLGHFVSAISGSNLYRKSSFLLDCLDQPVFPAHIQIDERPHLLKSLGSAPFDENGVATRPNIFIENGILRSYALSVYSARKLGMQTTGNAGGVHNLFINTGTKDLAALLKTMDTGLLVTDLMGQGVNLVTGDYSRGASGFWVEGGEIQYPVQEITIAGNLRDLYRRIIEVGTDVDKRGNIQTGSILIESMMVAGD